ncbi:MAG: type II toxin-antitoxin system RelE/ParE family toxin [Aeromicrobium sp.]|uniref:type II toxin-antitoxin system RelE family toxin n=1 Tax=Aeromicrobium sp. TaxID=1871063 RepID=UPI0039E71675
MRVTEAAVEDLERMMRKGDPQVVRWALKKMILLERDPEAGEPLLGTLIGWRKIVVGDRDWRVVWRVGHDATGTVIVDVAEVWAFGARSDAEVYDEVARRVTESPDSSATAALSEVLARLGKISRGIEATPEPTAADSLSLPTWLRDVLLKVVNLPEDQIDAMSEPEAQQAWLDYQMGQ